jgi:hypothetical protein
MEWWSVQDFVYGTRLTGHTRLRTILWNGHPFFRTGPQAFPCFCKGINIVF